MIQLIKLNKEEIMNKKEENKQKHIISNSFNTFKYVTLNETEIETEENNIKIINNKSKNPLN